jgi:adhesin transport system membrane fusion protein
MINLIEKILSKLLPFGEGKAGNWDLEADLARHEQEPLRARALLYWSLLVIAILCVWASFAELEEVTRGQGRVIPSRQIQIIQAVDGGVVSDILVNEGQVVEKGQLLVRIDPTRFISELRENRSQYLSLLAKAERLRALSEERPFVPPPEVVNETPEVAQREQTLYTSSQEELNAQIAIARQQLRQRQQELNEATANRDQLGSRYELLAQEFAVTKPLVSSGAVSEVEILRLERDVIATRGERDQVLSQIERILSSINEAERKIQEVELTFDNNIRRDLSETLARLGSVTEEKMGLADRVKHTDVVSPVHGTIKRLLVNTVGGFIQAGKDIIELVPLDDSLILEARINPKDIGFLRPGQKAQVRFTAYDFAIYGSLEARVEQIGADSVIDEKGNAYFLVRVRTTKPDLGDNLPVIPGMMATIDVITGKKTLLAYLLKPILRAKASALRER